MELLTCPVGWCEFFLFGGVNSSGIWSYRRGSIPGVWWMLFGVEHRLESGVGEEAWCGGDGTSSCVTLTRGDLAHTTRGFPLHHPILRWSSPLFLLPRYLSQGTKRTPTPSLHVSPCIHAPRILI